MKKQMGGQDKFIMERVQQGIQNNQEKLQKTVNMQAELITKLRMEKNLLCKNTYDLQERLKDTRHELHLTQKELYSLQSHQAQAQDKSLNIQSNFSNGKPGAKGNQIIHYNGRDEKQFEQNNNKDIYQQENEQLDSFRVEMKENKTNGKRLGFGVARSLALAKIPFNAPSEAEKKYNWLFNDDETPRQEIDVDTNRNTNAKMLRKNKYLDQNEEELTAANSNFLNRGGLQNQGNTYENLTDTMNSMTENQDEVLLRRKHDQHTRGSPQVRESIVGKSIQGVKNILRKAKDGEFKELVSRVSLGGNSRPNAHIIDHNNVEIEFGIGNNSKFDDNPLDDDSN